MEKVRNASEPSIHICRFRFAEPAQLAVPAKDFLQIFVAFRPAMHQ